MRRLPPGTLSRQLTVSAMPDAASSDEERGVSLQIVFRVPARVHDDEEAPVHERRLEDVPAAIAHEIVDAFTAYTKDPSEAKRREAYTYKRVSAGVSDGEMLLALDFGEVISLKVSPDGRDEA